METCIEGKYGEFNTELWKLCQTDPGEGGFTMDEWIDLRTAKFVRQANQAEHARVAMALNHYFPSCPKCDHRNSTSSPVCKHCNTPLKESAKG